MKRERLFVNCLMFVLALGNITCLLAQNTTGKIPTKSKADIFWESKPDNPVHKRSINREGAPLTAEEKKKNEEIEMENRKLDEIYCRKLRDWGLTFWKKFPTDKRRFEWLKMTIGPWNVPYYFKDMDKGPIGKCDWLYEYPIDIEERRKWEVQYQKLRAEFMSSPQVTKYDRVELVQGEIAQVYGPVYIQRCSFAREGKKFDLAEWTGKIMDFAKDYYHVYTQHDSSTSSLPLVYKNNPNEEYDDAIAYTANFIFRLSSLYEVTTEELEMLANTFANSPYSNLRLFGNAKKEVLALRKKPFELKYKAVDGSEVDLEKMRGKLVFLDFWSTSCTSCINKMTEVKDVYEKYRSQGFEVISVCANPEIDKEQVMAIHDKIGAHWPLLMIGGQSSRSGFPAPNSLMRKIWAKYGLRSVPQLFLLDREGKLLEYNGVLVEDGKLEEVVKRYLKM